MDRIERRKEQQRLASERYRIRHPDKVKLSRDHYRQTKHEEVRPIIAIDAEGVDVDDGTHQLVLIGASTGDRQFNREGSGIGTERILDKFLLHVLMENRNAIFVGFGFKYDTRMIFRDVSLIEWESIKAQATTTIFKKKYRVTWSKNQLSITFLKVPGKPTITIYDIVDFFGGTFVDAVNTYLSPMFSEGSEQLFNKVVEGKKNRGKLSLDDFDEIFDYWDAEIGFMSWLVEAARDAIKKYCGITVTQWNTVTQLTTRMLAKHKADSFMQKAPSNVPVAEAFNGARIEPFYVGHINEPVWDYDINGAYGYALKWLPDLTTGKWVEIRGEDFNWGEDYKSFGIYEVEYESWMGPTSSIPHPLPVKYRKSLLFPAVAHTYVWGPEVWPIKNEVTLIKAWVYLDDGSRPLANMADELWNVRMDARANNDPVEKIVKQTLARVIGKFCQTFGTKIDIVTGEVEKLPRYRCLEYAGFLTSLTRAQLYEAMNIVIKEGGRVFSCNTDGFTSDLDIGVRLKQCHGFGDDLGQWKARKYEDLIIVETNMSLFKNYPHHIQGSNKEWVVKKAGYSASYPVTVETVMGELSRDDVWDYDSPMEFAGIEFNDMDMEWHTVVKVRHLSGTGKRIHTGECKACKMGIKPSDGPHALIPRAVLA